MLKIAVSACLLGEPIRYDKTGQRDRFITDKLGKYASFVPFCPEHLAFGTPRETIRIVLENEHKKVITVFSKNDVTDAMNTAMAHELEKIKKEELCGIILKSKSPSCGLGSTKYYMKEMSEGKKDGLFATLCKEHFVDFPIEEEARLLDPWLRENFVMQLFAYADAQMLEKNIQTMRELVAFHTAYKFLLQSKHEANYRLLGKIVANHETKSVMEITQAYLALFKQTLNHKSTIAKTVNVLQHMVGFFKKELTSSEKQELHLQIEEFRDEIIPLIAVMSTIEFLAKKYNTTYLLGQKFLNPYPKDLALRSMIQVGK
ncbi:YbgA family protein [Sulfurospirillum sp.]|uniref:YbgA family protein n=1 Tax=Sulfurospirillum sp. TaxID=2053622 RepID=UPI002FDD4B6B